MGTQTVRRAAPRPPQPVLTPVAKQGPPAARSRNGANVLVPPAGGNQAALRTLAASPDRPKEAPAAPGSGTPAPLAGAAKPTVKLPPISDQVRAQMVTDVDRLATIMKSWFIESGDQITVIGVIDKYARLDGGVRTDGTTSTTPHLDHFLILLKSRAFSRSSVKSLFQDQWAILYDALWYRLRGHYLDKFRALVNRSHTQRTDGPGDKDVENGLALIAKQEAMGMWGMLKGMGTGLVGIAGPAVAQEIAKSFDETGNILFGHEWDASEPLVWGMNAGQIGTAGGDVIWQLVTFARGAGPAKAGKIYALIDKLKRLMGVGAGLQGVYLGASGIAQLIEERQKTGQPITAHALMHDSNFVDQVVVVVTSAIGTVLAVKGAPGSKSEAVTRERIQLLMGQAHIAASLARFSEIAASDKTDAEKEREYGQAAVSLIGQLASSVRDAHGYAKAKGMPDATPAVAPPTQPPARAPEAPAAEQPALPTPKATTKQPATPAPETVAKPVRQQKESGELSRKTMNDAAPPSSKKPPRLHPESEAGQQLQGKLRGEVESGLAPRKAPATPDDVKSGARASRYKPNPDVSVNVGKPVRTLEEARARYDDVIAETQGKYEVGIYQKPDGTFAVRLGQADKVDAPTEWRTVQHYHTNEPDIPLWRMPARADLNEPFQRAERTGKPTTEFTEYPLPGGKRGRASYTVHPDGSLEIRFMDADGKVVVKPFPSIAAYNDYYKAQTVFVAPGSDAYKQLTAGLGKPKAADDPSLSTKTMFGPGKTKSQSQSAVAAVAAPDDFSIPAIDPFSLKTPPADVKKTIGRPQRTVTSEGTAPTAPPPAVKKTIGPKQKKAASTATAPKPGVEKTIGPKTKTKTKTKAKAKTDSTVETAEATPRKQSQQVLNEDARIKAAEEKAQLDARVARQQALIDANKAPATEAQRLQELKAAPKRMPAELEGDIRRLPTDPDQQLEALRELQQKSDLSAEAVEYLKWRTELQDLRLDASGRVSAVKKQSDAKQGLEARVPDAVARLRQASKTIKALLRRVGPNYRQTSNINFDEVLTESRYNALPPDQKHKGLQTDHLVPLDWVANSKEMTAFLKAYADAPPAEQERMAQALVDLGDIPDNLVRMRADANNFKSAKSWSEMSLEDLKRYGYDGDDHKKMIQREAGMLATIKQRILALANGERP